MTLRRRTQFPGHDSPKLISGCIYQKHVMRLPETRNVYALFLLLPSPSLTASPRSKIRHCGTAFLTGEYQNLARQAKPTEQELLDSTWSDGRGATIARITTQFRLS